MVIIFRWRKVEKGRNEEKVYYNEAGHQRNTTAINTVNAPDILYNETGHPYPPEQPPIIYTFQQDSSAPEDHEYSHLEVSQQSQDIIDDENDEYQTIDADHHHTYASLV